MLTKQVLLDLPINQLTTFNMKTREITNCVGIPPGRRMSVLYMYKPSLQHSYVSSEAQELLRNKNIRIYCISIYIKYMIETSGLAL